MAINKTYEEKILEPNSQKVLLAHLEPAQRTILWTLHSGSVYKRTVSLYVIDAKIDTTSLTEVTSTSLSPGQWFFDVEAGIVYIRLSDSSNPKDSFVSLTHRLFMSDTPILHTHDLTEGGNNISYEARIKNNPFFPQEIDDANQLGISLESSGRLTLENTDGFWESIFDKLFWENKTVTLYSWFPDTKLSEAKKIFTGIITDKEYSELTVTFRLKDEIFKLRQNIDLSLFSASDGDISDSIIGTPKRRIYGEVKGLSLQSISQTLAGFAVTGTLSGTASSQTVTGSGTSFLSELSPGDDLSTTVDSDDIIIKVDSVETNTSFTASENIVTSFGGNSVINSPEIPYRGKNRTLLIAGHKLKEPSTTITTVVRLNRIEVADVSGFIVDDTVFVNGVVNEIKRIDGDVLILLQVLVSPVAGQTVTREPVRDVFFDKSEFSITRDYTVTNTTESKIVFNSLAEFNITSRQKIIGNASFATGTRVVNGSGSNFLADFKPRDWIISGDITHQVWYEILQITDETTMAIRIGYGGSTTSLPGAGKKNVTYMDDDSIITINTVGMERSGNWIKTASDVVKDIIENDVGLTNIDTDSFDDADIEAPFTMSLKLPLVKGGPIPRVRDVINFCNKSVFGSLISKTDGTIAFNILSSEKPTDLTELNDDDIESFSVKTRTEIFRTVTARFNFFDADVNTGESGSDILTASTTTSFVDNLIGSKDTKDVDLHLFIEQEAEIIAERYALYHSLTQSVVNVKAKLNLTLKNIGDKVFLSLDRLYQRFGSTSKKKIGIVSKISRSAESTEVRYTDLSGIFNRVGTIAPDTANDFSSATDNDKILNGYVVDDSTELPSSSTDDEASTNLIG